jgi:hypothetical protein
VRRYVALMDREKLGLAICVEANVSLLRHKEGLGGGLRAAGGRQPRDHGMRQHHRRGRLRDQGRGARHEAYDHFLQERLFKLKGVASIRSNVVLREVKHDTALPPLPG